MTTKNKLPRFKVRITVDESAVVEAMDEDEAVGKLWDEIMNSGAWGSEVEELEDEDGIN